VTADVNSGLAASVTEQVVPVGMPVIRRVSVPVRVKV